MMSLRLSFHQSTRAQVHILFQRFVTLDRALHGLSMDDLKVAGLPPVAQALFVHGFDKTDKGFVDFDKFLSFLRIFHKNNGRANKIRFIFNFMQAFGGGDPDDDILELMVRSIPSPKQTCINKHPCAYISTLLC